jgi:hypothetical protein
LWKQSGKSVDKKKTDGVKFSKSWKSENPEESSRWNTFIDEHNCVINKLANQRSLSTNKSGLVSKEPSSATNIDISSSQCSIVTNKGKICLGAVQQPVKVSKNNQDQILKD